MNPAELIVTLAARIQAANPTPDSPEWRFCSAVAAWISGEHDSLDAALGLCGEVGIETARTRYLRAQRDYHLRQAHALVEGASPWSRSVSLAAEVNRFEAVIWVRWRHLDAPPETASRLRAHLWHAKKAGEIPASPTGLHRICGI